MKWRGSQRLHVTGYFETKELTSDVPEGKRIVVAALFGAEIFVSSTVLPTPIDKMAKPAGTNAII